MAKDHVSDLPSPLQRGGYTARFAANVRDIAATQRLRHLCFVEAAGRAPLPGGVEQDGFDGACQHVLVEDRSGALVCCYRVMALGSGAQIHTSYSAQYYDLKGLISFEGPMVELGRFCVDPQVSDPDVLRIAWGMLAAFVDLRGAKLLFGCSSFAGTDPAVYRAAFDLLADKHLAPQALRPAVLAPDIVPFASTAQPVADRALALGQVPALLRTYLSMGGFVSDHAVIDHQMQTLHVFTALEIAAIPAARAKALRAIAH